MHSRRIVGVDAFSHSRPPAATTNVYQPHVAKQPLRLRQLRLWLRQTTTLATRSSQAAW